MGTDRRATDPAGSPAAAGPRRRAVPEWAPAVSRRALLAGAVVGATAAAGTASAAASKHPEGAESVPHGKGHPGSGAQRGPGRDHEHQPGIATPVLPYLSLAGFDVAVRGRDALVAVLRTWTGVAARLTGTPSTTPGTGGPLPGGAPVESAGGWVERPPASGALTLTFGFGASLFRGDRFGIGARRPALLAPLPAFPGEALDPAAGNGDLCVQACASDPTTAQYAVRALLNAARPSVSLRWRQSGYRAEDGTRDPRGLFDFREGTANLDVSDERQTAEHLWVDTGPAWLHGGSYLVMRRIRLLLDTWDRTGRAVQEAAVGRDREHNQRLLRAPAAHVELASPGRNGGAKLLRRSFSYDAGVDPNGLLDAGLIFLCYQRDPWRQFVAIQRRLSAHDPLNGYSQHLAAGLYACPPAIRPGSFIGAELLS